MSTRSKPQKRPASPMATVPVKDLPPPTIPCTFPNCKLFFRTVEEMRKHKATFPEHEYCHTCDLDCETEDQLLIHKIKSEKHTVCPVCGIEFGSEGGRDRHIRLFHRTTQNLTCHGCKSTFRSAAGLMRHIEDGECTVISQNRLLFEQSKKLMRKEALEISGPPGVASLVDADEEGDGGVELPMTLSERNREAMANQPQQLRDRKDGGSSRLVNEQWPKLSAGDETGLEDLTDLLAFTSISTKKDEDKDNTGWKNKGCERSVASASGSIVGSAIASSAGAGAGSIGPPDAGLVLEKIYREWDAANFIDEFTGEYVCACGKRCVTKEGFEKHVLAKSQGSRRMQCPGCLKIFKSTAAIIAHWESATTRCDVSDGNLYAQIVDEVSGGMIQIAGYNEDGTTKYEAGEVDLQKTKTVGVDLDQFGW
ncbi:hypothetical protein BDW62DRAFT_215076 [Aspergillus aurantiobrunneus]